MIYDLSKEYDKQRFKARTNHLYTKGGTVELTDIARRSPKQNSYLHLIVSFLAVELGLRSEYVKTEYYKRICNPELYIEKKFDKVLEKDVEMVKSSKDLNTEEMSLSIKRFRNWSAENGYYLPDETEEAMLQNMNIEVQKHKQYL